MWMGPMKFSYWSTQCSLRSVNGLHLLRKLAVICQRRKPTIFGAHLLRYLNYQNWELLFVRGLHCLGWCTKYVVANVRAMSQDSGAMAGADQMASEGYATAMATSAKTPCSLAWILAYPYLIPGLSTCQLLRLSSPQWFALPLDLDVPNSTYIRYHLRPSKRSTSKWRERATTLDMFTAL